MKRKVTGKSPGLFTARKEIPNLLSLYTRTRGMPKQWGNILSENRKIFAFCSNKSIQGQLYLSLTYPTTSRWLWLPSFYRGMSRSILTYFLLHVFSRDNYMFIEHKPFCVLAPIDIIFLVKSLLVSGTHLFWKFYCIMLCFTHKI